MEFNELEKEIIKEIISLDRDKKLNVLANILEHKIFHENGYYVAIESEEKSSLKIEQEYFNNLSKEYGKYGVKYLIEGISHDLIVIVRLLHNLERNNLITISGEFEDVSLGIIQEGVTYISYYDFDKEIKSLLFKYASKRITPTANLYSLVENDFKSEEERRFEKQLKQGNRNLTLSVIAIIVSVICTAVTIIVSSISVSKIEITKPVEVENQYFSSLNSLESKESLLFRVGEIVSSLNSVKTTIQDANNRSELENINKELNNITIILYQIEENQLPQNTEHNSE